MREREREREGERVRETENAECVIFTPLSIHSDLQFISLSGKSRPTQCPVSGQEVLTHSHFLKSDHFLSTPTSQLPQHIENGIVTNVTSSHGPVVKTHARGSKGVWMSMNFLMAMCVCVCEELKGDFFSTHAQTESPWPRPLLSLHLQACATFHTCPPPPRVP